MDELMAAMATWVPLTLTPVLLVLVAPSVGPRARTVFAILLGALALAAVTLATVRLGETSRLEVINPFYDPAQGQPVRKVVGVVEAQGWIWPTAGAVLVLLPALLLFALRRRAPATPWPVGYPLLLTVWTLSARLVLELAAAPEALTWAVGVTVPTLVMLPFVGYWCAVSGATFGGFVLRLLLLALLQRSLVVGFGWFATTEGLGTHLDVRAIKEVDLLVGHRDFQGEGDQTVRQWRTLLLIPQLVLWVPITVASGILLGGLPFLARRRSGGKP